MKKLLAKIRKILKDRRTRQLLTRIVSITAAVVVFITTYALVLPAITMESEANCGIPAHQHDDSCYEERLICGQVEGPGHQHTDACYSISKSLICAETEHQHDDSCFDADGNLTCDLAEHTHDDSCYEEVRELVCDIPESEGHEHTDDCYERVLACGMEAHTHSTACYSHGSELTASAPSDFAAVATTELGSYGATVSASTEAETDSTEASNAWASGESAAGGLSSTATATTGAAAADYSSTAAVAGTASTGFDAATTEDAFVPQLEPIYIEQLLTKDTGIYYYHAEEGEVVPENSADIADWKRVNDDTELTPADLLRVYLRYTIPAGALNATNDIARYRLPSNLHLTDQQMEAINTTVNGIANQYVNLDTLEITDTERYNTYLGIEATEGTRKPSDDVDEYFTNHPDLEGQEYINAVVRAENVFDETTEEYLGQDLVFTFTPYTVQKNQHEYDAEGQPTKAGQKVNGWLCFDLHMDQIDWSEPVISTIEDPAAPAQDVPVENTEDTENSDTAEASEKVASDMDEDASLSSSNPDELNTNTITEKKDSSAEIVFAAKDKTLKIDEIRTELHLVELNTIEKENKSVQDEPDQSADDSTDNANSEMTDGKDDIADDSNPEGEADKPESANEPATDTENQPESAMEINAETYPAVSFEDTITVQAGTLSTDNESAAQATPAETAITVSVIAEEETFPLGTTMQLGTVEDMDTVASAVEGAIEGQTRGFHAVDISFHNADGEEIEPLKPIKVSMTSDAIKQAVEDSSTVPVVVHLENPTDSENNTAFAGSEQSTDLTENNTDADKNSADTDAKSDHKAEVSENAPIATIVEANETSATDPSNKTKEKADTLSFDAGSFSVYAIIYTVDFHYEINGKMYDFSIPGGGFVSFADLVELLGVAKKNDSETASDEWNIIEADTSDSVDAEEDSSEDKKISLEDIVVTEETWRFLEEVEKVEISSPDLVWVDKVEETSTVGDLKEKNKLEVTFSAELSDTQIHDIDQTEVQAGDWAIISLKPFETEEKLTVTMKNGDMWTVNVTDEQNAFMNEDGETVQTIPNPTGTKIELFDYWLDKETELARRGWTGYNRQTGGDGTNYNNFLGGNARHNGSEEGINKGHKLKFVPAADDTAQDYWKGNGNSAGWTSNGRLDGINSWNGRWNNGNVYNGAPTQGIVAGALYDKNGNLANNGYPRLNLNNGQGDASNRESLDYLFNPQTSHSGKKYYGSTNNLFYVDPDGYYTYESMDYSAHLENDGRYTLRKQPTTASKEGEIGFWPIEKLNYWLGMHMQVEFSMPANGEVLNPKGKYMPMQFEFAGDDDAWVYIDGILVADGGGIHNRTEIDVNFKTGYAQVRGGEYTSITNPNEPVVTNKTLYQIFEEAHNKGLISDEKWASEYTNTDTKTVWVDVDGDDKFDTFAPGTKHTFDFFYLERGGGESNLYIHYNLISTTDFTAHKSYHPQSNTEDARLNRNQYYFELIGFDNPDYADNNLQEAIMPDPVVLDNSRPSGDFENPKKEHVAATADMDAHTVVMISATEDGNVNFGNKQISSAYAGKQYKYMVREVVPADAVNADGVRWDQAVEELKEEGGFVKDGIMYDSRIYYFIGTVQETSPGSGQYELKKTRFLDPDYSIPDTQTKFFSFVNGFEKPVKLKVIKKSDTGKLLSGAEFSLTRAMQHHDNKWVVREYRLNNEEEVRHSVPVTAVSENGELTFNNLIEGHYILEETAAPAGFAMGATHRWLLTLEKEDSADKILLVSYITPLDEEGNTTGNRVALEMPDANDTIEYEVLNGPLPPIDLSLEKKWNDNGDTSVPENASATFKLMQSCTKSTVTVELVDKNNKLLDSKEAGVGSVLTLNQFEMKINPPAFNNGNGWDKTTTGPWWNQTTTYTKIVNTQANVSVQGAPPSFHITTQNTYEWRNNQAVIIDTFNSISGDYTVEENDLNNDKITLKLTDKTESQFVTGKTPKIKITGGTNGNATLVREFASFTLPTDGDNANSWKKTFEDLPSVDDNGNPYTYYFEEDSHTPAEYNIQRITVNGTAAAIGSGSTLTTDSEVVVTNNAPEKPKITAVKVWQDETGNAITDDTGLQGLEVKLTLYKGTSAATADDTSSEITQSVTGNGQAVWNMKSFNADVTQYSVKETAVKIPGGDFLDVTTENPFTGTVTGDSTVGYTITNQLPVTELSVTKQWKDGTSANADKVFDSAKTISFTLYQKLGTSDPSVYTGFGTVGVGTITYTPASGSTAAAWSTVTAQNLPKYVYSAGAWHEAVYYPVEAEIENVSITTAYQKGSEDPSETPAGAAAASGTVTIINTDIVVPLKIVKIDNNTEQGIRGAKFQLTRKLPGEGGFTKFVHDSFDPDPENGNKKFGPFTVTETTGIILEDLLPGEYHIEETIAPDGYIITLQPFDFTVNADGTVSYPGADDNALVTIIEKDGTAPAGFEIGNTPGAALPSTGGPGTRLFTILGSILIFGAGVLLWRRRRLI